ncbi:BrnA antitoxin family protein [Nostoc sp.]|uniref:BrnA antitoxin family protein n=1 Tax=Nostoc sp. TaxID=1180 RepID=UPI002FF58B76
MNNESISSKSKTDWARLDAMSDEDIDLSDCPEVTPEMFVKAVVRRSPSRQARVTLTIDRDVLEWFEAQGDRAEQQMALALKIYAEANKAYLIDLE